VLIYCATNTCGTDCLHSERNLLQSGLTLTHGVSVTFTSTDSIKNAQDFAASVTLSQQRDENLLGHNKEEKCQLRSERFECL
jgi:hypothetical protein